MQDSGSTSDHQSFLWLLAGAELQGGGEEAENTVSDVASLCPTASRQTCVLVLVLPRAKRWHFVCLPHLLRWSCDWQGEPPRSKSILPYLGGDRKVRTLLGPYQDT